MNMELAATVYGARGASVGAGSEQVVGEDEPVSVVPIIREAGAVELRVALRLLAPEDRVEPVHTSPSMRTARTSTVRVDVDRYVGKRG
jgi:hypothetical protein